MGRIRIRVVPSARKTELHGHLADGTLKVRLAAPPVDGKANEALVQWLSERLDVRRPHIRIVRGVKGRLKEIEIEGLSDGQITTALTGSPPTRVR